MGLVRSAHGVRGKQTAKRRSIESALVFGCMNYSKVMNLSLIKLKPGGA